MNHNLSVHLPAAPAVSYPIRIKAGLLSNPAAWIPKTGQSIVIITDHRVKKLYGLDLENCLKQAGHQTLLLSFPAGERSKTVQTKTRLEALMLKKGFGRDTLLLALGGGVVGDLAGFIAATYMRGIAYIQIPTTLLAMVDSSVGGKTGINSAEGKNLVGAFWHPKVVIADPLCLETLPQEHLINGLIEIWKICLSCDLNQLRYFQRHLPLALQREEKILASLISRAVKLKIAVVQADEQKQHYRDILNFGHTLGHALERLSAYRLLHGQAVGYGLLLEAKISQLMGILDLKGYETIQETLSYLNISPAYLKRFNVQALIKATRSDKKKRGRRVPYVLLKGLGEVYVKQGQVTHFVPEPIIKEAFFTITRGLTYGG